MRRTGRWKQFILIGLCTSLVSGALVLVAQEQRTARRRLRLATVVSDCNFLQNPEEFRIDPEQRFSHLTKLTAGVSDYTSGLTSAPAMDAAMAPRKNFIDSEIF